MNAVDERSGLSEIAEIGGWERNNLDHVDHYIRGPVRVRVVWQGSSAISGAVLYQDDIMMTYTRELSTVDGWLKR